MAIIRDGEKYACSTCIKGHRVAGCKHSDRDLILVRRRGRPSTQCEHCKRLRNGNRKVHTKCVCGSNATTTTTTDMEYDSSSNSSSNNNAINSTFYFTGVIANNTINTYNNSNGTSNGNSVRSNNIVPAIAPKSYLDVNVVVQRIVDVVPLSLACQPC
ncbi:copper fist DNA binding domain-containing protein [Syncephalis plumigaleata]|nr:copper fist DNA binding domain-containing protein [Syncephalis plumigaleata]